MKARWLAERRAIVDLVIQHSDAELLQKILDRLEKSCALRRPNRPRARGGAAAALGRTTAGRAAGRCHRAARGSVMTLPESELSFYFAAAAHLSPRCVLSSPSAPPRPWARIRTRVPVGLWIPSAIAELRPSRWNRVRQVSTGPRSALVGHASVPTRQLDTNRT